MFILKVMFEYCFISIYLWTWLSRSVCLWDMFESRAWIQFMYCRSLYRDNVSKGKAAIRESASPHPSKISERLAYFIFEHPWNIRPAQWKNSTGQIQGVPSLEVLGNLNLHFIMFVQDFVPCAIKQLSGYSTKIWNLTIAVSTEILSKCEIVRLDYGF